ncbi:ThuA domain-containing protein [Planctomicrobium sp. SH661]|uniref:ThuA domain-containing protein n=1 Tax=Planctomicrobium sp. SH661 TaxID=3448124 RepID=UPI003F5C07BF
MRNHALLSCALLLGLCSQTAFAEPLQFVGEKGPGVGKHIVFLAGDHEYRSEETLPALARILAKHHGFKCTVLFNVDPKSGEIVPGNNNLPGTEALKDADLMVIFTRFQDLPVEQMQPIADYLKRGGPVVGLRTSTHAFNIPPGKEFSRFSFDYEGDDFKKGFGRQILGETWAGHYGDNHRMSTRLEIVPAEAGHPVLKGVERPWVQAGGYWTDPEPDSTILALAQPLEGMTEDSPPAEGKKPCPGAWVRTYKSPSGQSGRVFTTTYGASEDILNEDYRRMLINACLWAAGLEQQITPDLNIEFVGPYHPATFSFDGHRRGVKPLDMAGWDTPIMNPEKPTK